MKEVGKTDGEGRQEQRRDEGKKRENVNMCSSYFPLSQEGE